MLSLWFSSVLGFAWIDALNTKHFDKYATEVNSDLNIATMLWKFSLLCPVSEKVKVFIGHSFIFFFLFRRQNSFAYEVFFTTTALSLPIRTDHDIDIVNNNKKKNEKNLLSNTCERIDITITLGNYPEALIVIPMYANIILNKFYLNLLYKWSEFFPVESTDAD